MGSHRIIGIDPGSRHTGWGVIDVVGSELRLVGCGVISTAGRKTDPDSFSARLVKIYDDLRDLLVEHEPDGAAVESVFHARNANSALKLGHARAAALLALAHQGVVVDEYAPREVKQAVTGTGGADKQQVARMVEILVGRTHAMRSDATDAVAVAICHAAVGATRSRLVG